MLNTLFGTKKNMSQTFVGDTRVSTTVVKVDPNTITQIKTDKKDGYWGVQMGVGEKKIKNISKPVKGHLKGAKKYEKIGPRFIREVRLTKETDRKVGEEIKVSDIFNVGDFVNVAGVSKGKGFAGAMKRHGFGGGSRTHGQSDRPRSPGSIGQGTTPGRVRKGKKMAGRMGGDRIMIRNLRVIFVDQENNELHLSGSVPGTRGSLLVIKKVREGKLSSMEVETKEVKKQEEVVEEGEVKEAAQE